MTRPTVFAHVDQIRRIAPAEVGKACLGCGEPLKEGKHIAVLVGGGLCCSQACVEIEDGRLVNLDMAEDAAVDRFIDEQSV